MTTRLTFADHATRDDLRIFLERLLRAGQPEVRMVSRGSVLAVFGCTQFAVSLTENVPVVLVHRGFALNELKDELAEPIDATVMARAVLDRLARMGPIGLTLDLPDTVVSAAWAGVLPPVSGWQAAGLVDGDSLEQVAREGVERVAAALPEQPGDAVVRQVRARVWGAEIVAGLPAAAAFAADAMGFLSDQTVMHMSKSATWTRIANDRGQVAVRRLWG